MEVNSRRTSTLIFLGIGAVFFVIMMVQYYAMNGDDTFTRGLELSREQKDLQFQSSPNSPIIPSERSSFKGLVYFEPNISYKVEAAFEEIVTHDTLVLMTSTGDDYKVITEGTLSFDLQGLSHKLTAYRYLDPAKKDLFVPFRDLTSRGETYGGGRYLEVPTNQDPLILDFNEAYNPYCVYNDEYVCPIPPPENKLSIEVRAGEKMYVKE